MRLKSLFLILLISFGHLQCHEKQTVQSILSQSLKSIEQTISINGEIGFNFGSPSPDSDLITTSYRGNFHLKKTDNDSIIGWYLAENMDDLLNDMSYQSFYKGKELIYLMKKDSTLEVQPAKSVELNFTIDIIFHKLFGNVSLYSDKLFMTDSVFKLKQDSWLVGDITMLPDTIIRGTKCYMIQNEKHGNTPKYNSVYSNIEKIAIDKKNYFPIYLKTHFKRFVDGEQEIDQTCTFELSKLNINAPISDDLFSFNQIETDISKQIYDEITELKEGDDLPNLELLKVNEDSLLLSSLIGQISILEFGYIGCAPCMLVSAELKKSQLKFKDNPKIKFYYINFIDKIERIKEYSKRENNPFEILIGNKKNANDLGIKSYPTIMIVDKYNKISKILIGYHGAEMSKEINKNIDDLNLKGLLHN